MRVTNFGTGYVGLVTGTCLADDPEAMLEARRTVVVTEWKQFRSPDFGRLKSTLRDGMVFDGRNLYHPTQVEAAGLAYYGIGRGRPIRAH
jgi:UDPglucose 6-dehydrogenase